MSDDLLSMHEYASPKQWEIVQAYVANDCSATVTADVLSCGRGTVRSAISRVRRKAAVVEGGGVPMADADEAAIDKLVPAGARLVGTSIRGLMPDGRTVWARSKAAPMPPEDIMRVLRDAAEDWLRDGPEPALVEPTRDHDSDLLAVYGYGDPHMGLHCWGKETGHDFDLKIGSENLVEVTRLLVSAAPSAERAAAIYVGDNTHNDSQDNRTPRSKHQLDVDTRYPKVIQETLLTVVASVELMLEKHKQVDVLFMPGNHDPNTSPAIKLAIHAWYRNQPRVTVDIENHSYYQYLQHGACLLGTSHGDGAKAADLPLIMAEDHAAWSETEYRHWYTGHIHHGVQRDYVGCTVQSLRTMARAGSYARQHGYRSKQSMTCDIWHKDRGRVSQQTVPIEQVERSLRGGE